MKKLLTALLCLISTFVFGQIQCANDSTGLIPLVDLGTGFYEGHQGGLYPGGTNVMPSSHRKKGNNISKALKPLDSLGNVNYEEGRIIFLGLGASLASNAFNAYIDSIKIYDFEGMNNCLDVKGMFFGGKDLDQMIDFEDNSYWQSVANKMEDRGDTYEQVQIIWLLQQSFEDTTSDFDTYYTNVLAKFVTLMQVLKDTFPNLKQVFLSGVHYMGYMDPLHFRYDAFVEPHGYWGNIVIKELIAKQITGDPALKYTGPAPAAAWLGWGPNFWADGKNPRAYDGLSWDCDQYRTDGTGGGFHLLDSVDALGVEAQMLKTFFKTNTVAKTWHQAGALWSTCPEPLKTENTLQTTNAINIFPNPSNGTFIIKLPGLIINDFNLIITDQVGRAVYTQSFSNYQFSTIEFKSQLTPGIYFVQLYGSDFQLQNTVVISK